MSTLTTRDGTEICYKDWGGGPAVADDVGNAIWRVTGSSPAPRLPGEK